MDAFLISQYHLRSCNKYSLGPSILRRKMEAFVHMHSSPVHQKFSPGVISFLPHLDCMNLRKGTVVLQLKANCYPYKFGYSRKENKQTNIQVRQNHNGAKPVSDILHICSAQICFVILLNLNNI